MRRHKIVGSAIVTKTPVQTSSSFDFDFEGLEWYSHGKLGPSGLTREARDLIEIARLVWEIDKQSPKRISSQRVRSIDVEFPLREPSVWTNDAKNVLCSILRLLGNADWTWKFLGRRRSEETSLDRLAVTLAAEPEPFVATEVALFSGGLDSTCGLAWLKTEGKNPILVSSYGTKGKQDVIKTSMGFKDHFQAKSVWAGRGSRFGGQFQYRSFLYLCLGASIAHSYDASLVFQFENGPLAIALPPSGTYRMTRHAHPMLHALVEDLFAQILGRKISVSNPFLTLTKRQAAEVLRSHLGDEDALRNVLLQTETCWNLHSPNVLGSIRKTIGQPCGLCIPCLVRRTALFSDPVTHRFDFGSRKSIERVPEAARIHVEAYRRWSEKMLSSAFSREEFEFALPLAAREAVAHAGSFLDSGAMFELYKRFAFEIDDTFFRH